MDDARWERVQAIFHDAAALDPAERAAFLEHACDGDGLLRDEVVALLREDAAQHTLLDGGVARVAGSLLDPHVTTVPNHDFGPWRLTDFLGEGGTGVVYRAERSDIGGTAAVKILRDAGLSPVRRNRFAAEQRTLARLHHPNIAQLYHADTLPDGTPWFAMEYVDGATLTDHCAASRASLHERLHLFTMVGDAVQHAHGLAIIHRDLKPSNILVTRDGTVKLLDFGVARQLDRDAADHTRTGLRLMTPAYAAPEQVLDRPLGVHTDVYALGVILYELLTGRLPFDLTGLPPGDAVQRVLMQEPVRPSVAARGDGPVAMGRAEWADLDVLVMTALHKDPARRYRTVDALLADIGRFRSGEPLAARPDGVRYRTGKFLRRHRRPVAMAATAVALLVVLTSFFTLRLARARDAALGEAARSERIEQFMLSLFQGGEVDVLPPDSLRVSTLLERGLHEADALASEPAVQTELLATLGGLYRRLGELDRADSLLQVVVDRQRGLSAGGAQADVARGLLALALLRIDQAQFQEAESLAREARSIAARTLPRTHPIAIEAIETVGLAQQERGAYDEAAASLEQALRLHAFADTTSARFAGTLVLLANTRFYAGTYDAADSLNQHALLLYRRARGDNHPLVADVLINLGAIRFQRGAFDEAEAFYRDALDVIEPWYGADHHATASALTMLGRSLVMQARRAEAVRVLERALTIHERVHGPEHPRVASVVNELGTIALQEERLDDAQRHFGRILEIYQTIHGDAHWLPGIALSNLGAVALARLDYATADRYFRDAAARFTASQGPDHLNTGIARAKLGRALLGLNRWQDAIVELEAGLAIVEREASPTVSWAVAARADLTAARAALERP